MTTKKIKAYRITMVVIAVLMFLFAVLDEIFFKLTSSNGFILLAIITGTMGAINPEKSKKVEVNPKTMKILLSLTIIFLVSGLITFILTV